MVLGGEEKTKSGCRLGSTGGKDGFYEALLDECKHNRPVMAGGLRVCKFFLLDVADGQYVQSLFKNPTCNST